MSRLDREQGITNSEDRMLQGRGYKLLNKLGDGSYAKVYLCQFTKSNTRSLVACKVMDTTKASKRFVKKFLPRELDILLKIDHPHIIHIHSILRRHTKYYIFMRYAERGDVLEYISRHGAVTERQARIWFRQLVLALHYLHELDIAHRDLKCENLLLTANYNIKIADFGFARHVKGPDDMSETYCGSLSYSAPEVLRGNPYDPKRADIWACGIILFILLNRAMPFSDANARRLLQMQLNRCWWFRSKVEQKLSKQVKELIPRLLEPNCVKRPSIDKITCCDWISMEPELLRLSLAEAEALIKLADEKMRLADAGDKLESQLELNSLETDGLPQETMEPQNSEHEARTALKKKRQWRKKINNARMICELKSAVSNDDLLATGSLQHNYTWQKGKRPELYVGDAKLLPCESATEEPKKIENIENIDSEMNNNKEVT